MRLTHECGAHEHAQCGHVISATLGGSNGTHMNPKVVYCECPCHEVLLLRAAVEFMKEMLNNLKTARTL